MIYHSDLPGSGPYVQTWTGKEVPLLDTPPELIDLEDIVYATSNLNRYTGHGGQYSVAQHLLLCEMLAQKLTGNNKIRRGALMHDAGEAYLGDVSSPLKRLLPAYREIEGRLNHHLQDRFGIFFLNDHVRKIDVLALNIEAPHLLGVLKGDGWPLPAYGIEPWMDQAFQDFYTMSPAFVRTTFRAKCAELHLG